MELTAPGPSAIHTSLELASQQDHTTNTSITASTDFIKSQKQHDFSNISYLISTCTRLSMWKEDQMAAQQLNKKCLLMKAWGTWKSFTSWLRILWADNNMLLCQCLYEICSYLFPLCRVARSSQKSWWKQYLQDNSGVPQKECRGVWHIRSLFLTKKLFRNLFSLRQVWLANGC